MKNEKIIKLEVSLEDLLNISEMCEHYIECTAEEIDIDKDLLESYENTLNKIIAIYNANRE